MADTSLEWSKGVLLQSKDITYRCQIHIELCIAYATYSGEICANCTQKDCFIVLKGFVYIRVSHN